MIQENKEIASSMTVRALTLSGADAVMSMERLPSPCCGSHTLQALLTLGVVSNHGRCLPNRKTVPLGWKLVSP